MALPLSAQTIPQQACRFLEQRPVSSFEDDSPLARALAEQYPTALEMCLAAADWSFASRLVSLPPSDLPAGEIADTELAYTYAVPSGLVALRWVDEDVNFRRDGTVIRADVADGLKIRYTRGDLSEAQLPATFVTFVALQLAVLLAPEFVGTRTKRQDLKADLAEARTAARQVHVRDASASRLDGRPRQGDWATEATK